VRTFDSANQFIQFDMHRLGVTVLGILNQEYHQECNDRCSRIDDELPGIAKAKERTSDQPQYYASGGELCVDLIRIGVPSRQSEYDRMSGSTRRLFCKIREP
jgi:hypothetical protein